jgi:cytochrome oxidase Cu insertion factor (SCO1/SenC/PrrC family)
MIIIENKVFAVIIIALIGGSVIGFTGAYFYFSPQLRNARLEIDNLKKKLDSGVSDELTESTGRGEAPDFSLIDLDGKNFTLSEMRGKVVLLDFMATWCGPCQAAMPDLVKLYEERGDEVVMISISIDPSFDTDEVLSSWRDQWGANWIHARDLADPPVGQLYFVRAIPTYVIIDQFGNIQYRHIGSVHLNILRSELSSLIN